MTQFLYLSNTSIIYSIKELESIKKYIKELESIKNSIKNYIKKFESNQRINNLEHFQEIRISHLLNISKQPL